MLLSARGNLHSDEGPGRHRRSAVTRTTAGISLALVVALVVGLPTPGVADELDDRKSALENEIAEVQQSLEYLDSDIAETIATLRTYQGQLPAAQQSLADAQGRVETAAGEVSTLAERVELAQETKNKITEELRADQQQMEETREVIGQIATEAYKNGGVPTNVSLLLGAEDVEDFTESMDLVDQALRSQNAAMERLSEQNATNANIEARLAAVEAEITRLKERAEEALAAEQSARDAAAEEKAKVDELIADTTVLSAELQAQKPVIEAELASVEQAQQQTNNEIAERQRRLIEEARKAEEARLAEEARKAQEARVAAEAAAEAQRRADTAAAEERARQQAENDRRAAEETRRREEEAAAANRPAPAPVAPQVAPPVKPAPVAAPPVVPAPIAAPPRPQNTGPSAFGLRAPVSGPITSSFGFRPTPIGTIDFNGSGGYMHTGIDYGVGCWTSLYAPAAGEVWYADADALPGAGNRIVISHGVVGGNALATNYYHLTSYVVSVGQRVSAGQLIGYTGTTGNSTGCHLHFETMLNGTLVDPIGLL